MPTSVYAQHRAAFVQAIAQATDRPVSEIDALVKPAEPAHGDLTFPTFSLAKSQRKAPPAIASGLSQSLKVPGLEIAAAGPYVNARFSIEPFTREVINAARSENTRYGSSEAGAGKTVVLDYSAPNIAKPIAFHHIRSTVIGHALANLYRSQGWRTEGVNYLGDWGKQFGLVAVGYEEYGDPAKKEDMGHLVEVYVKANARAEKDSAFDERARDFFRRMEANDAEALALWRQLREISLEQFAKIYKRLGIAHEHTEGESLYQGRMQPVIEAISRKIGTKESQGALIVDLPYAENEPPVMLRKNDGSTLYATRDLAAAFNRFERFHFDRSLYVVAADQALHFRQVFSVLKAMDAPWADRCVHVPFGRVHGMSTRKGQVVLLNDVLDEAKSLAKERVLDNQKAGRIQTQDVDALAEQIGLGAVVFGDLKNRRMSDYTFDWNEVLSFDGHTGPYLQYAHARACNVLARGGGAPREFDPTLLTAPEEQALVRDIARLPVAVTEAVAQDEPSIVSRLLLDAAAGFSRWYTAGNQERDKRVLVEGNDAMRASRLALTDAFRATLAAGLSLLGISPPQNM